MPKPMSVLILAGQRPGVDPLCSATGVARKADVPVLGKAMLDYVLATISAWSRSSKLYISGYDGDLRGYELAPSGVGPADSVYKALNAGVTYPCLVTTCDHVLLSEQMIEAFIIGAQKSGADMCAGFATKDVISQDYPYTKRTYLKFSDESVSGCNLFYLANAQGLKAVDFWRQAQHLRKQPFKLARKIGFGVGIKYLFGRLSLKGAFDYASQRIGTTVKPVLLPYAEAAIDVDKAEDLELVTQILKNRVENGKKA